MYSMRAEALKIMEDHMAEVTELKKPGSGRSRGAGPSSTQFASLESLSSVNTVVLSHHHTIFL